MPKLVIRDGNSLLCRRIRYEVSSLPLWKREAIMETMTLERIEAQIQQLPFSDQLRLLEKLVVQIRRRGTAPGRDSPLQSMAEDPEVQQELRAIEAEFAGTEADGLKIG